MSRMQVLPLPTLKAGEYEQTPFILILDQIDEEAFSTAELEHLKHTTGAAAVIAHEATIDAPGQIELTDEQRDALVAHLTKPTNTSLTIDASDYREALEKGGGIPPIHRP